MIPYTIYVQNIGNKYIKINIRNYVLVMGQVDAHDEWL